MSGELAGYDWLDNPRGAGSAYAEQAYHPYRPVVLLHQTVSRTMSASYIRGHGSPPHLWANPYSGEKFQTVPLDRAALALYQPQFGYHWTNKHSYLLQTEIIGIPEVSRATYSDAQDRWIGEQVIAPQARWLRERGLPIDLTRVRYHADTSGSASEYWHGRMSEAEMADFNGIMCHIDAWGNDHWDCSAERTYRWAEHAIAALGPEPGPTKRKTIPMDMTVRRGAPVANPITGLPELGSIIVAARGSTDAFTIKDSPVIFYDAPFVPAGARAVIAPIDASLGPFEVVPIISQDPAGALKPKGQAHFGNAYRTEPLTVGSWVTFVVPERAIPMRVRAYIL